MGAICTEIISRSRPSARPCFILSTRGLCNQESVTEAGNARRYKREQGHGVTERTEPSECEEVGEVGEDEMEVVVVEVTRKKKKKRSGKNEKRGRIFRRVSARARRITR